MSCIPLNALQTWMTTTELMPTVNREVRTPWLPQNTAQKPVRMNWVVVTKDNGTPQLRMNWNAAQDD